MNRRAFLAGLLYAPLTPVHIVAAQKSQIRVISAPVQSLKSKSITRVWGDEIDHWPDDDRILAARRQLEVLRAYEAAGMCAAAVLGGIVEYIKDNGVPK